MSKTKVKISKLAYNGQFHFKVDVPTTSTTRIKAVSSRKFSRTHRCWHLPNPLNILDELRLYFEIRVRAIDLCAVFDSLKKATVGSVTIYGCLLYTSPSPRDATLSRMPSSA